MKAKNLVYWLTRLLAAAIMLQTLYFKFSASAESVYIFTTVGMEPWGRIVVGIFELIASVLLVWSTTAWLGAFLGAGLMAGAIGMHLTLLGIEVKDDGGYLFSLACVVLACSTYILFYNRHTILTILERVTGKKIKSA